MIKSIQQVKHSVENEMDFFEKKFRTSLDSSVPLVNRITHYIIKRKGKQMRPLFVFLSAKLFSDNVNESTYNAASLIELLHTATLVHDDVVDEAKYRRGFFSINALWKNKVAVLVGDYLLSQGLLLAVRSKEFSLLELVSTAVKQMSEGELLQMEKSRSMSTTESDYYKIIKQKTASLIAACCASGAQSMGVSDKVKDKMWEFGELVGLAFQIKDDLLDFNETSITGKVRGIDLKEKKLTLPVIYTINNCSEPESKKILKIIKSGKINTKSVDYVYSKIKETGGIAYSEAKMKELIDEAFSILEGLDLKNSAEDLESLVMYTTSRKK